MWNCESWTTCTPELHRLAVFKIMKNFEETCITESKEELFLRAPITCKNATVSSVYFAISYQKQALLGVCLDRSFHKKTIHDGLYFLVKLLKSCTKVKHCVKNVQIRTGKNSVFGHFSRSEEERKTYIPIPKFHKIKIKIKHRGVFKTQSDIRYGTFKHHPWRFTGSWMHLWNKPVFSLALYFLLHFFICFLLDQKQVAK